MAPDRHLTPPKTHIFLSLISSVPFRQPLPIAEADLPGLRQLALDHGLFMLLYSRMQAYQQQFPDPPALEAFIEGEKALYLQGISVSMMQEAIEGKLVALLREKGIPAIVIKGNAIARGIYGDPNCRASSDIDFLIRKADAHAADYALRSGGYRGDEEIALEYCLQRIHHAEYHEPGINTLLEMHWGFGVPYFFRLTSEEIWQDTVVDEAGNAQLTPAMILIMLLIHHHSHSFRALRILVDILWALDKFGSSMDLSAFSARLKTIGLTRSTLLTLSQLTALWPDVSKSIPAIGELDEAFSGAGCRVPAYLTTYFRMDINRHSVPQLYKDKLIARFALDRWSTIMFSFWRTLVPPPEAIRALYSDHRIWTLPVNYLRYLAWRIKDWTA